MPDTIDIVFRTVTVMAALLLGAVQILSGPRRRAALPGAFCCLAVAAFFVTSVPGFPVPRAGWAYLLTALCVSKAVWFWLFARALFNDDARLGGRHLAIVGAVAIVGTWQQTVFLTQYRSGAATTLEMIAGFGFDGAVLLFVLLGLSEAWRDMAVDLVNRRRRLRIGFIVASGVYLAMTLSVQTYNLAQNVATPTLVMQANMTLVTATCLAAAWFLLRPRSASWLDSAQAAPALPLSRSESVVLADLKHALEVDRIFLREGLTIGALAEHLGTSENLLRRVINHGMGHRNFNDFLHTWRIREACEELARPEQQRQPVLSIAMKVGYGSVGAFNRAFKARVGTTPTDYRRSVLNGASHAR